MHTYMHLGQRDTYGPGQKYAYFFILQVLGGAFVDEEARDVRMPFKCGTHQCRDSLVVRARTRRPDTHRHT